MSSLPPVVLHVVPAAARTSQRRLEDIAEERARAREAAAYARGEAAGRAATIDSGASALEAALSGLEERAVRAEQELGPYAVELAVEIARAILHVRIDAGDYDLERIVRSALSDSAVGRGDVTVHLHPLDHRALEGVLFRTGTSLEIDPSLDRGDVHVGTPRGLVVRDVEEALESVREQLLEELAR